MANASPAAAGRRLLDRAEQVLLLGLYCGLVYRVWPAHLSSADWPRWLLLVSEGLAVLLILIRRPAASISRSTRDWIVALAATGLPLLVTRGGTPFQPSLGGLLMLIGLAMHLGALLSLRRSFGVVAANRGLRADGLYTLLRHPMYAGYMVTNVGFLLAFPSWWNLAIYLTDWTLQVSRILAEERVLTDDPDYRRYMARVPYRLFPGVF